MRFPLFPALVLLCVNVLIDAYVYCALHSYFRARIWSRIQTVTAVIFNLALVMTICLPKREGGDDVLAAVMWMLYGYLSIYIPKLLWVLTDVLSRLPMLWRGHRWRWMSRSGAVLGVALCAVMWWGALYNRFQTQVVEQTVDIKRLPRNFDGLRIAQISDLHLGTFGGDTAFVSQLVDEINGLNPDVVVFTGDIVNRRTEELEPFTSVLSRLKAPMGTYSIMGNHDYGDYYNWDSHDERLANERDLKSMQERMGWRMLNNSTQWLRKGSDSIALIGVENVGDPPFHTYGDLHKAYPAAGDNNVKVLLSHNPAHWVDDIADNQDMNIDLTLSGHTHAMQIEAFGWSPAAWRYPTWGGMYQDKKGRKLYVNIGVGTVGFPARIGATPEITLFTLTRH